MHAARQLRPTVTHCTQVDLRARSSETLAKDENPLSNHETYCLDLYPIEPLIYHHLRLVNHLPSPANCISLLVPGLSRSSSLLLSIVESSTASSGSRDFFRPFTTSKLGILLSY
ncbi:hypothetical protein CGCF413_v010446 [Colletotrichum fructicola]|nr:hypothetical protein CGCF413_v010446 [Colletotrichum fructicola]